MSARIIVTRPGVLSAKDKQALRAAGVVPIEAENPDDVRLIDVEGPPVSGGDMARAAVSALIGSGCRTDARAEFVAALAKAVNKSGGQS